MADGTAGSDQDDETVTKGTGERPGDDEAVTKGTGERPEDDETVTKGTGERPEDDEAVVQAAVEAAEDVIFSAYARSDLRDLDVGVQFEDGVLDVDVYLDADGDAQQVADDAALAARSAVDDLLER